MEAAAERGETRSRGEAILARESCTIRELCRSRLKKKDNKRRIRMAYHQHPQQYKHGSKSIHIGNDDDDAGFGSGFAVSMIPLYIFPLITAQTSHFQ